MEHQGPWDHKTAYERHDLELARLEVEHTALQEKIKGMDHNVEVQAEIEPNNMEQEQSGNGGRAKTKVLYHIGYPIQ